MSIGLGANLTQGYSSGGSQQVASGGGWSSTDATSARQWSEQQATTAYNRQVELQKMAQEYNAIEAEKARNFNSAEAQIAREYDANYNSLEAQKQRDWQEEMANTIYTRSVKNMKEAGINPILAANMGLSGASVGSGATASLAGVSANAGSSASIGAGSAPMAQSFMDSQSGWSNQSNGSSWNSSESGLATALSALGGMISSAMAGLNAGNTINLAIDGINNAIEKVKDTSIGKTFTNAGEAIKDIKEVVQGKQGLGEAIKNSMKKGINAGIVKGYYNK